MKNFLVGCYGRIIFIMTHETIKNLQRALNSRKAHKLYHTRRVLFLMHKLIKSNRQLKFLKGSSLRKKVDILRYIGRKLGRFALLSVHNH